MARTVGGRSWLFGFSGFIVLLVTLFEWPRHWIVSGAGPATYLALAAAARDGHVFPSVALWAAIATMNLVYAIASTSWLLSGVFIASIYPAIFVASVFQFRVIGNFVRKWLRKILIGLQFTRDKIALFNLPALEINQEVDGLMVIRGATISLSSLTLVVHGVEVGIKFSDDLELALVVDTVTIRLFRSIHISDVYGNVKGGQHEMTFAQLDAQSPISENRAFINSNTPLLKAAFAAGDEQESAMMLMNEVASETPGPVDSTPTEAMQSILSMSPDDKKASEEYDKTVASIEKTSIIGQSRRNVFQKADEAEDTSFDPKNDPKGLRAAICSNLHPKPSIAHPPKQSVSVTTLQNLSSPSTRRFLHRFPLLLRLLLNPIAFFHPVHIDSIAIGASGKWAGSMLHDNVFAKIGDSDSDIKRLKRRILAWLADANFAVLLTDIVGSAQVPVVPSHKITSKLVFGDMIAYRALPEQVALKQVVRLGGADAAVELPAFLLPHHEHILPPEPSKERDQEMQRRVDETDSKPKAAQAEEDKKRVERDEAVIKISVHARLPACFDQDLLNFISALVKVTKIIEIEREDLATPQGSTLDLAAAAAEGSVKESKPTFKDLTKTMARHVGDSMRDGMRKAAIDATLNDRWIAKLVGKVTRKLETAQGDVGYSGNVPLSLKPYREKGRGELPKILG